MGPSLASLPPRAPPPPPLALLPSMPTLADADVSIYCMFHLIAWGPGAMTAFPCSTLLLTFGRVRDAHSTSSLLLSASRDCTARLWDARCKMPLLHVFQVPSLPARRRPRDAPGDRTQLPGADAARACARRTSDCRGGAWRPQGHSNTVTSVLFSHDDTFALTASDDCTVKVHPLIVPVCMSVIVSLLCVYIASRSSHRERRRLCRGPLPCVRCALALPPCPLTPAAASSQTEAALACGSGPGERMDV